MCGAPSISLIAGEIERSSCAYVPSVFPLWKEVSLKLVYFPTGLLVFRVLKILTGSTQESCQNV